MIGFSLRPAFWRNWPIAVKASIAIAGPLFLLAVGFDLLSAKVMDESGTRRHLAQTIEERKSLDRLSQHLLMMESTLWSYLHSYEPKVQVRYLKVRGNVLRELEKCEQIRSQDGRNSQALSSLHVRIANKLKASDTLVSAGPHSSSAAELFTLHSTEAVEESISALKEEDERALALDLQNLADFHRKTAMGGVLAIGLGALLSGASIFFFNRSLALRLQALQVDVRAIKFEAPLEVEEACADEVGILRSELQMTSEKLASRVFSLRESEGQLKAIFDNTDAVMYLKDLESRFILINRSYEKRFGLTADKATGRAPLELFGREMGEKLRANDLKVFETKRPMQFEESIVVNGTRFTYLSLKTPLQDSEGKVYGLCGVSTEITDLNPPDTWDSNSASPAFNNRLLPLGQQQTVLVVEDEDAVAQMEALLLRTLGYKVIVAEDGERAEHIVASSVIDLVMADYRLPRMNGLQLIERLERVSPKPKAILVSGDAVDDPVAERFPLLRKPFEIRELARRVHNILD